MDQNYESLNPYIKTQKDLENLLEGYGIETYKWNTKAFKSVESLFEEITTDKAQILKSNETLVRKTRIVGINIFYKIEHLNGEFILLRLRESMQIKIDKEKGFSSKNILKRTYNTSIGKKLTVNEDILKGAIDLLKIRLQLNNVSDHLLKNYTQHQKIQESNSYPGLKTIYETNEYDMFLDSTQFLPDGYCFEKKGILTILEWVIN